MQDENSEAPKFIDWKTVRCGNCQFWEEEGSQFRQCKYRAPSSNGFPMTSELSWCGDFYPWKRFFVRK